MDFCYLETKEYMEFHQVDDKISSILIFIELESTFVN